MSPTRPAPGLFFGSRSISEPILRCVGFKDYFREHSKFFTQANKEQQRENIHDVYSVSKNLSKITGIEEISAESRTVSHPVLCTG